MREIKYEAWHKKYKKMYKVLHLHMETNEIWATVRGRDPIEDKDIHIQIQPKDVIIRQYTGLKDKNGKEIYECDVLNFNSYIRNNLNRKGIVYFDLDQSKYKLVPVDAYVINAGNGGYSGFVFDKVICSGAEVIGNIYENPELLEVNP